MSGSTRTDSFTLASATPATASLERESAPDRVRPAHPALRNRLFVAPAAPAHAASTKGYRHWLGCPHLNYFFAFVLFGLFSDKLVYLREITQLGGCHARFAAPHQYSPDVGKPRQANGRSEAGAGRQSRFGRTPLWQAGLPLCFRRG